ncbi:acyl-activating enzyme 13 [Neoconidiobolus thromboides FSU 785]|nr:acyl-activating enzyme 13 [Neoconidiobolus thromboides FSU 785]
MLRLSNLFKQRLFISTHRMYSSKLNLPLIPIFTKPLRNLNNDLTKSSIIEDNKAYTYSQVFQGVHRIKNMLLKDQKKKFLQAERVAYLMPNSLEYACTQWGIWACGATAVPLGLSHPIKELEYVLENSQSKVLLYHPQYEDKVKQLKQNINIECIPLTKEILLAENSNLDFEFFEFDLEKEALFIYTSGTTGKPKGVVLTYKNILAMMDALTTAWDYQKSDHILHCLPLHHVHVRIKALNCILYNGGTVQFIKYNPDQLWKQFLTNKQINMFMAVPTIYATLIQCYSKLTDEEKKQVTENFKSYRLMASGSSALPSTVFDQWHQISGHKLLERYGMSEIGMALTNPYSPIEERTKGHVGLPFPTVEIRLVDEDNNVIYNNNQSGEIQIRGPSVFKEYWKNEIATKEAFTKDGWFKTGDIAELTLDHGYRILGRNSVDIIKYKGFKLSALEIEKEILDFEAISECTVLGLPHQEFGESILALLVLKSGYSFDKEKLLTFLSDKLADYKLPNRFEVLDQIPKNAMGKVNKKALKADYI